MKISELFKVEGLGVIVTGGASGLGLGFVEALAANGERLVASGRELYAWHPKGVARSKL